MEIERVKPQLHQSHLGLLSQCGERFRRVVIEGEREPRGTALIIGSATHEAVKDDLEHKIGNGELLPDEAVKDYARDSLGRLWDEEPLMLDEQERSLGLKAVKGKAIDQSVALSMAHHQHIAPGITPKVFDDGRHGIEWKWVIEADGYPYDLAGTVDVVDIGRGVAIRDTKTAKAMPPQTMVDKSEQLSWYAMAYKITQGVMPDWVGIDALVKGKRGVKAKSFESIRTEDDFKVARSRFQRAIEIIDAEAFAPAGPNDFLCSPKFCGFYSSCPFVNGARVTATVEIKINGDGGNRNGNARAPKSKIKPGSPEWLAVLGE